MGSKISSCGLNTRDETSAASESTVDEVLV
jgi:hypothetical protein